jgi:2-iminoacetate synthase ThiH
MVDMISRAGRVAVERNAYYDELRVYDMEMAAD